MADSKTMDLKVTGMSCMHCRMAVERALKGVSGVSTASVDLASGRAKVTYDPGQAGLKDFEKAVEEAGYSVAQA